MDRKDFELAHDENMNALRELQQGIANLTKELKDKTETVIKQADDLKIKGEVTVTNQVETIDRSDIDDVIDALNSLEKTVTEAISDNAYKPLDTVIVKNLKDAKQDAIKVTNLEDIKSYFESLENAIKANQPIVNVEKQAIELPTAANKPISVRLSDGKRFYDAIMQAVAGGGGLPSSVLRDTDDGVAIAIVNPDGTPIGVSSGGGGGGGGSSTTWSVINAIQDTNYNLNGAAYNETSSITSDFILDSIEFAFSTTEPRTITVTSDNGTVLYSDTNNNLSVSLTDINVAYNGSDNFNITVTQTSGACTMDIVAKVKKGETALTGSQDVDYSVNDIEEGTTSYFGKTNSNADWLIVKVTDTSVSYATVLNNGTVTSYTDAWTDKATLTYGRKDEAF